METVNGKPVRDLQDLAKALDDPSPTYHTIELSHGRQVVLKARECGSATCKILDQFQVPQDRSDSLVGGCAGGGVQP